jgi:hypothetical protein
MEVYRTEKGLLDMDKQLTNYIGLEQNPVVSNELYMEPNTRVIFTLFHIIKFHSSMKYGAEEKNRTYLLNPDHLAW